jgi:UDP-2-acetamido-3-amino-2,3-dideoxy-glucuronate N-acetyltransferase
MPLVERFQFQHLLNPEGSIVVAHSERDVPFAIQRIYYLYGVPSGQTRGFHAHKTLMQIAVCVRGSCRFRLDNGAESDEIVLSKPSEGIVIRPMMWREMSEFTDDCVLLVLASAPYDESDYIRNYQDFRNVVAAR